MKKSILFTCTLLLASLFIGCSEKEEITELNEMVSSNDYTLSSTKGESFTVTKEANNFILKDAKTHVVIYDIFATWCPPCRAAVPHLSELQTKYANDILILGITIEDEITNKELDDFATEHKGTYTYVNSKDNRRLATAIASSVGAGQDFPIPFMAIYVDGKYFKHYNGSVEPEMIEADIKQALGK